TLRPLPADGRRAVLAALDLVRQALTTGGKAIRTASLAADELTLPSGGRSQFKWRVKLPADEKDLEATRLARLCRIAGAQSVTGDLAAGAETASQVVDGDFKACALALALS